MRSFIAVTCLVLTASQAWADQFYYARSRSNGAGEVGLFLWDDTTNSITQVGGSGAVYLQHATDGNLVVLGLAASSTGTLYGFALDDAATPGFLPFVTPSCGSTTNRSRLVTIDTTTAVISYVGPWLDGRLIQGAAFDGQGRLWAIDCHFQHALQIEPATGNIIGAPAANAVWGTNLAFAANGYGIIGSGSNQFRLFNPANGFVSSIGIPVQNQGFTDGYNLQGMAFTAHLAARNGDTAATECRLNVLDTFNADELGHINDAFSANPSVSYREASQMDPPGVTFSGTVGSIARVGGPVLPNCFYDWGDAPVSFGTVRADNGPRHLIVAGGPYLGAGPPDFNVDAASFGAFTSDDQSGDDEDGVVFGTFTRGGAGQIQVTVGNAGPNTRLQVWIDWDDDGGFAQASDRILTDATVTNGVNTFSVPVPETAVNTSAIAARFRIADQSGLGFTGPAASGEVEDYSFNLEPPPPPTSGAEMSVTITDNSETYRPGTSVAYTITVFNNGPEAILGARVGSSRPAGITTASWTCVGVNGGVCNPASGTANIGVFPSPTARADLPVGASVIYTHTLDVPANFPGNLIKSASVGTTGASKNDPILSNNSATDTDRPAQADMTITMTGPSASAAGQDLTYVLTVTNNGTETATSVSVTDAPPAGLTFVSNAGACTTAFPCAVGDVAPDDTRTITTTYHVPGSYTTPNPIVTSATVTNTTPDPDSANNTASASTLVGPARSDLQIVKNVSSATVTPGQTYSYTLQATNNGPSDAVNVSVTDNLPTQAQFVSSIAGCTASGQLVTCPAIPTMTAGALATFDLVVQLGPSYTGDGSDILNSARVTSDTTDPAPQNNTNPAGAPPVGPAGADLTLVKTVSADPVTPGQTLTYSLLLSNQGPSTATDVVVTDPLPAGLTFVSSPQGCTAVAQLVTCPTVPALNPGESMPFAIVVRLDSAYSGDGSDLGNRATVQSPTPDPVDNNTTPPVSPVLAGASADLSATKVVLGGAVAPGVVFTYRITVGNAGPSTAANVIVTDTLPAPLNFASSPQQCTAAGRIVTCTRAAIAPGTTATFDLLVQLDPWYAGDGSDLTNTATVTSSTPDPTPGNSNPTPTPPPPIGVGSADVTITKSGPSGTLRAGGEVTYTLVVTNQGPGAAMDVEVQDPTPAGLTFLENTGDCTTPFPCAIGTLAPGLAKTINARYSVSAGLTGVVANTATVTSTTPDPQGSSNTATVQTPPDPVSYYLGEGATGGFFDDDLLIANPNTAPARVTITFFREDGTTVTDTRTIPAQARVTVHVGAIAGLEQAAVSARVVSQDGLPLAVERTMFWDATHYAGHGSTAVTQSSMRWLFAEGSQGYFSTYLLLQNSNATAATVTLTFMRETEAPVLKTITVQPFSRETVDMGTIDELQDRAFAIIVDATQPIVAERSIYFGTTATRLWSGGDSSLGVTEPSARWFLSEGATGGFFDTFILLGNPQAIDAHVTIDYQLQSGEVVSVSKVVKAESRLTINVEEEADARLQNAAFATRVTADLPIVAERSMYWIGKPDVWPWAEGHNSFGLTESALRWAIAEGRVGGPENFHTYVLLTNAQDTPAAVTVTYLRENGAAPIVKQYTVPPTTRFTVDVNVDVPELQDEAFGARIEVTNGVTIAVERSMYWDASGILWSGGTNAPGTKLP